jgi:hypothetical protein
MSKRRDGSQSHHVMPSKCFTEGWSSPTKRTAGVGTAVPKRRTVTVHELRLGTETRNSRVRPGSALVADA